MGGEPTIDPVTITGLNREVTITNMETSQSQGENLNTSILTPDKNFSYKAGSTVPSGNIQHLLTSYNIPQNNYFLQYKDGKIGWHEFTNSSTFDIGALDDIPGLAVNDLIAFLDIDDSTQKKGTIENLGTFLGGLFAEGNGISSSGTSLGINVDDTGIEINSDTLRLKDSGVVASKIASNAVTLDKMANIS